ncbi:hypothetical protein [Burkholderia pseudomallei]|uniref:hypothetical protein n=2 Tax=Burkholderia pseudomallei TaxID=28450 RepID=UPI0009B1A846|nr:hypothetical protein [Burkholderia pseudomallei]
MGHYIVASGSQTVLRCHMEAFEHLGGAPREILYDRMKAAVFGFKDEADSDKEEAKTHRLVMIYGYESCSDIAWGIGEFTKGACGRRFSVE